MQENMNDICWNKTKKATYINEIQLKKMTTRLIDNYDTEYTYGIYIFINESTHQRPRERNTTKERASPGSISHSSYGIAAAISQSQATHIDCFSLIFIGTRMIRQSSLWFANKSTAFSFKRRMLSKGGIFRHNCEDLSLIEHRLD